MATEDLSREEKLAEKYGVPPEKIREMSGKQGVPSREYWESEPSARPVQNSTVHVGAPITRRDTPLSLILGGILLFLILALLIFYRNPRQSNQITQTAITEDTASQVITEADTAGIPEMTQAERDSIYFASQPPKVVDPTPVRRSTPVRRRSSTRAVLTTSSSLNAYQRLAELKAEGNSRARLRTVNRRGVTLYSVQTN